MRVLIDGFDLQDGYGTGISTYTKCLCSALREDNDIYMLHGVDIKSNCNIVKENFFQKFYSYKNTKKPKKIGSKIKKIIKNILQSKSYFIELENDDYKFLPEDYIAKGIYNINRIYEYSKIRFLLSKSFYHIRNNHKIDIYHKPCPVPIHMNGAINITTIHDVIPLEYPISTNINLNLYYELIKKTINKSDYIITVSEYSKKSILKFFNAEREKIKVIYNTSNLHKYVMNADDDIIKKYLHQFYNLEYNNYLLFFGTIEPKKNIDRIIKASFQAKSNLPLVIAGQDGWANEQTKSIIKKIIERNPDRLHRYSYIPAKDLSYLIRGAAMLVFPSLCEGFGLPVLESMSLGCPVITSNTTSLPEVGGEAVHYVNPYNIDEIADGIDRIFNDLEYRSLLIEKGEKQAKKFSESIFLNSIRQIYK